MNPKLSDREKEVLYYTMEGYSAQETADKIHLSIETIKSHRRRIIAKFEAKNIIQAVALYLMEGTPESIEEVPEIILQMRLKHLLRRLMTRLEGELNDELGVLLKRAMKDLRF